MESIANALKSGTVLDKRYKIEAVLGEGGFGITYKAHDEKLDCTVVIKEFLPNDFAARGTDSVSVQPRTNRNDDFEYGLKSFLAEARTLAKFQHRHIVAVTNFIEANGSAYFVMNYAAGIDLSEWLKTRTAPLDEATILGIITPILDGLSEVHKTGLMHRDIKPGNIYLRKVGGPMLIDFGAARQALGEHSKSLSAIISQGYAPPEQYTTRGKQGAFIDLYAIGATLYELIIGQAPIESSDRSHAKAEGDADPMIPALEAGQGKVSDWLLQLTDQLLNISAKDRPQTAEAVLLAIKNKTTADVDADSSAQPSKRKTLIIAAIVVVIAIVIGGGWWFTQSDTNKSVRMNSNLQEAQSKTLAKGNAILYVDSQPADAEIYLGNILLGRTPYKNEQLPKGEHELKLIHKDSEDHIDNITLADNEITKKQYQLKPASGNISIFSNPEGASIHIDGIDTGKRTPVTLKGITAGEHQLKLTLDRYYPKQTTISINKNKTSREDLSLGGGHLVEYKGEWLESKEKEKRMAKTKQIAAEAKRIADAKEVKRLADNKVREQQAAEEKTKRNLLPFIDNNNGTVSDSRNGLMWQRCRMGQQWKNNRCQGTATEHEWDQAKKLSSQWAGFSDWRLPTKNELITLIYCSSGKPKKFNDTEKSCEGDYARPTIHSEAFPGTQSSWYWSLSPYADNDYNAWYVYFFDGFVDYGYKGGSGYVRLVRGSQ